MSTSIETLERMKEIGEAVRELQASVRYHVDVLVVDASRENPSASKL